MGPPSQEKGRPNTGPALTTASTTEREGSSLDRPDDRGRVAHRRRWAYGLISRSPNPPPAYGSADWLALPEGSVTKVASCVIAAETWAQGGDTLVDDLRRDVDNARRSFKKIEDEEYRQRADDHRRAWATPTGRTFVQRRRAQLEAVAPREGDFLGRGNVAPARPSDQGQVSS